jgi:AcrR family transcriptional regulator
MRVARREPVVRDTKQRILDAALEVFGERGIRGASVDDVAEAAGVTKGAVYYYFTDKDDLVRDLQRTLWEDLSRDALVAYDPERAAVDNLIVCFEAFIVAVRGMSHVRRFLREVLLSSTLGTAARSDQGDTLGLIRGILQAGIERGEIASLDADALTRILVGALIEATFNILGTAEIEPTMAVIRRMIRSLAVTPSPAPVP